ncbi:MAG: type II secretion system protein N [Leptothrix sp. (in: b-proteobacteria)]
MVFWGLRLTSPAHALSSQVQTVQLDQAARGDVLRLFAAPPAASGAPVEIGAASRLRLLGVVAGADEGARGWALLSLDGQPPRTYAVGAVVDGTWVVQRVTRRQVLVGTPGAVAVAVLDLPEPAPAATGVLPGQTAGAPGVISVIGGGANNGRPGIGAAAPLQPIVQPQDNGMPDSPTQAPAR